MTVTSYNDIIKLVSASLELEADFYRVQTTKKDNIYLVARCILIHLASEYLNMSYRQIGEQLGTTYQRVYELNKRFKENMASAEENIYRRSYAKVMEVME